MADDPPPWVPESSHVEPPGYSKDHWDYVRRCSDVDFALTVAHQRIEEWDATADPHGWWHERPVLIALYNEVLRARSETGDTNV